MLKIVQEMRSEKGKIVIRIHGVYTYSCCCVRRFIGRFISRTQDLVACCVSSRSLSRSATDLRVLHLSNFVPSHHVIILKNTSTTKNKERRRSHKRIRCWPS